MNKDRFVAIFFESNSFIPNSRPAIPIVFAQSVLDNISSKIFENWS